MSIYAIILQEQEETVWDRVKERWPDCHYIWHSYAAFIAPSGIATSDGISEVLGFNSGDHKGVVIEVTRSHRGYVQASLAEWFKNAGKEPA